ncbi:MAG: ParB/RepB/Spo0J family partition protein [Oscillospiraceae bacterium]|nr:ParB/RepB/Spo0J family partition protein [Oscillospiraceae bacterium]
MKNNRYADDIYENPFGEDLVPGCYVENDPRKPKIEAFYYPQSEEELEQDRIFKEKVIERRVRNFKEGVNIFEDVQKIDIGLMQDAPTNWAYLPLPNDAQLISLMNSLESIGLINPIILLKHPNYDYYTILSGKSRVLALKNLYERDHLDKYRYPLCCILDSEKVDEYYLRSMILDLNFKYRTIPQDVFIRMILDRHALLKKSKKFRKESNVAELLAEEFLMSTSSIYNYLVLEKLSEEIKTLLYEKRITLQIARLFAKVNPAAQKMILENIDFKEINCLHRIKFIIGDGTGNVALEKIKRNVETSKDLLPEKISFNVTINKRLLGKTLETLMDLKKYASMNLSGIMGDNANRFCKITFDKDMMKYYVEKNIVDQKSVSKLTATKVQEILSK